MKLMTNVQKLMVIVQVLITKIKLRITNINIYEINVIRNEQVIAYCFRTKQYHNVCVNMFYNDHINYHYKKPFIHQSIMKGKLIDKQVLLS